MQLHVGNFDCIYFAECGRVVTSWLQKHHHLNMDWPNTWCDPKQTEVQVSYR